MYGSSNTPSSSSSSHIARPDSRSGRGGSSSSHAGGGSGSGSGGKDSAAYEGKEKEDGQGSAMLRAAAKRVALASAGGQGPGGVSPGQGLRGSPNQGLARGLALASAPNIRLDMGGGNPVSNNGVGGSPPASHPYSRNEHKAEENNHQAMEVDVLLDRMVQESGAMAVGLSQRLTSLRLLRKMWGKGEIRFCIHVLYCRHQ